MFNKFLFKNNKKEEKSDQNNILTLISNGNEVAFNNFMESYSSRLYYYALGIVGNKEMAEEIVSDVFMEVWKHRKELNDIEYLSSWLSAITYNKSITYIRKETRHSNVVPISAVENFNFPTIDSPLDNIVSEEESKELQQAIEELPPKCRHVFYLAKVDKMPYAEISKILDISLSTINYHVGFAMDALKKKLVNK